MHFRNLKNNEVYNSRENYIYNIYLYRFFYMYMIHILEFYYRFYMYVCADL